jgi:hypothetical protein
MRYARQPQRIAISTHRNTKLTTKHPAQVGLARSTSLCQLTYILRRVAFAQELKGTTHHRMQVGGVTCSLPRELTAPALQQQIVKPSVQSIRIAMFENEI